MSRICIISDVHGNLPALEAVIRHAGRCDLWWCAGDTVGYGPYPNECVRVIEGLCESAVAGNHDLGATGGIRLVAFNSLARRACRWTAGRLEPDARAYLEALPLTCDAGSESALVHGSFADPVWDYVVSKEQARRAFEACAQKICFNGHSHVPVLFACGSQGEIEEMQPSGDALRMLEEDRRYIVNVGSVGQPRDGDPRACYVIYETDDMTVTYHRVRYPVEVTQGRMAAEGLPRLLVERIAEGY